MRLVDRLGLLDQRALGQRPTTEAWPQVLPPGKVPQSVRRGVTILTCVLAASLVPIAFDAGRAILAALWMLAALVLTAASATLKTRDPTPLGPTFALIGAAASGLFALWLVGVVPLQPYQYGPTVGLAAIGGRMTWIVYRATQPSG